ncbi:MAG: hypothetical protein LBU23_05360 [Planctomycetota bacterium]|jgi:hypothetical protein|nr:hypothetical protein [Planctomycetota bacterium]
MGKGKKRSFAWLAAGWLALAGPAFSGEAAPLEKAHLLYRGKYAESGEGVYEDEGLLLVVAEVSPAPGGRDASRARAMLRGKTLLQDHAAAEYLDPAGKPPPCGLKIAFPRSIAFGRESVPDLGLPRLDLEAAVRVLEDRETPAGSYRHVLALRLADLLAKPPVGLYGEPSQEEVAAALGKTWRRRERDSALPEMCLAFGLVEDWLRLGDANIGFDWPGAPWLRAPENLDVRTLAANWAEAEKVLLDPGRRPQDLKQALAGAPPLPAMLAWLEDLAGKAGNPAEAALWRLWRGARPGLSGSAALWSKHPAMPGAAGEYDRLIEELSALTPPKAAPLSPLAVSWRCFGHADFAGGNRELPAAHQTALRLFGQGRDVERILALARQSVETAPGAAGGWALLGDGLRVKKESLAAIPVLTQALWLEAADADIRASLALACLDAGFPALSRGLAASVYFAGADPTDWSRKQAEAVLAGAGGKEEP